MCSVYSGCGYLLTPPNAGIDHVLAQHVAHLFIRNTVSLFEEKAKVTDVENDSDHFEVSRVCLCVCVCVWGRAVNLIVCQCSVTVICLQ